MSHAPPGPPRTTSSDEERGHAQAKPVESVPRVGPVLVGPGGLAEQCQLDEFVTYDEVRPPTTPAGRHPRQRPAAGGS
jgi:hypothetical protein